MPDNRYDYTLPFKRRLLAFINLTPGSVLFSRARLLLNFVGKEDKFPGVQNADIYLFPRGSYNLFSMPLICATPTFSIGGACLF